jgi:2-polyprenyl-3-methyl-5-hydroxy-6-metoxy-1,4-benzoquinol methylase
VSYTRYVIGAQPETADGWDAWADDYARLTANPTYALGKELLHEEVGRAVTRPGGRTLASALDFNCGAGDDVARLLAAGWQVVGCDGSPGMLRAAATRSAAELESGRLELWHGQAEQLELKAFGGRRFDLVFSTTGGFAYLDDSQFMRVHRVLATMLNPGGAMVIAHLTPFCLAETVYHLLHLRWGKAVERWSGRVPVSIRGKSLTMRLRSPGQIRALLKNVVQLERLTPLLWCTPPFQSGYVPGPRALARLRAIERRTARLSALARLADQVVCVARPFARTSRGSQSLIGS